MEEFEHLVNYEFEKDIFNRVRDVAIFQAFTGFSYQETYAAEPADIIKGVDGQDWISKNRQKTGFDESVPLLPIVKKIIEKYKADPKCTRSGRLLPVPTNEYYNRCLKEMAGIVKTKVLNNTHQFRFFFANEVTFNKGVPLKTVSKMLGHRSIKTTEIYVRANKSNIAENMQMVKGKLFDKNGNLKSKTDTNLFTTVNKQLLN
jgi:integrase